MRKLVINGKEYNVKFSFRSYMLYEEITDGKSVQDIKGIGDMLRLFYCSLKAYNDDFDCSFQTFIDLVEDDNAVVDELTSLFLASLGDVKKKKK